MKVKLSCIANIKYRTAATSRIGKRNCLAEENHTAETYNQGDLPARERNGAHAANE